MKIRRVTAAPFRIPFRRPLVIAGSTVRERAGILIRVCGAGGGVGIGEASGHPLDSADGLREAVRDLEGAESLLRQLSVEALENLPGMLDAMASPIARAGLAMACYDLAARAIAAPLAEVLGGKRRDRVRVNAFIDELEPRRAAAAALAVVRRGFRCLKVKLQPANVAGDVARVAAMRAAVGPEVAIRADANAAWGVAEAVAAIGKLAAYDLEYVEQPVADIAGLAAVRKLVTVPIAADECVTDAEAVEELAAARAADLVIVKPTLLGVPMALAVLRAARGCGIGAVITSAMETSVGIAAALQLAAAQPDPVRAAGLATAGLLVGDLVRRPLAAEDGWMEVPHTPGLGIELDERALRQWAAR